MGHSLVFYVIQEKGVSGDGLAGVAAGAALDELCHPFGRMLASAHLNERPHRSPDHVPQKPIRRNPEIPVR